MKNSNKNPGPVAAGLAFLISYGFFQFLYPYYLMRREQMSLFMYDGDYISQTYRGVGWLSRFLSDFLCQFYHLPVLGPFIAAIVVTAIGVVAYKISRRFLGRLGSLFIAAAFFSWTLIRETDYLFTTRYAVSVLGLLSLVLAAVQFKKKWAIPVAAVFFLAFGAWAFGSPVHKYYGVAWAKPALDYERIIGMDVEASGENWDKVLKLSEKDLNAQEETYYHNLAKAMKGNMGEGLCQYTQGGVNGLFFLWSVGQADEFRTCMSGEVWYHLGDMTQAEQSVITSLQASPNHTGARYLKRLAQINLISGEYGAAGKYLTMLSKTLNYRKWARRMMAEDLDDEADAWLKNARAKLADRDFIYYTTDLRPILRCMLEANPDNHLAQQYLLCYDILCFDLDAFVEDNSVYKLTDDSYQEASIIWLSHSDERTEDGVFEKFGISEDTVDRFKRFLKNPDWYKGTYFYHYLTAN